VREKEIETALVRAVKARGGLAIKFVSPGLNGVPDRLILMPGGCIAFIELKAPGRKMRPIQLKRAGQIEALGFRVFCIDSKDQIGGVIDDIQSS
jgi:hypothetical protein